MAALGSERPDLVAVTAAMLDATGLGPFARRFPERFYDVGIAEAHAAGSAAGLARGASTPSSPSTSPLPGVRSTRSSWTSPCTGSR